MVFRRSIPFFYCVLIFLVACSVQQRRYRPGLAVIWKHHTGEPAADNKNEATGKTPDKPATRLNPANQDRGPGAPEKVTEKKSFSSNILVEPGGPCDVLVFRDGTEVKANVISYDDGKVRYFKCDIDGPVFVVYTSKLFMIKFADGRKKVFEKESPDPFRKEDPGAVQHGNWNKSQVRHKGANTALVLAVIGALTVFFLIGFIIIAISMGGAVTALNDNKRSPGKYSNINAARIALALDLIVLAIFVIFLVILFSVIINQ